MEHDDIRRKLLNALATVAPEAKGEVIHDQENLQDQLDLDSVDILNYIIQVQKDFQREIANQDYRKFLTLKDAIAYLQ